MSLSSSFRRKLNNCYSLITGEVVQHEIPTFKVVLVGKFCKFDFSSPIMPSIYEWLLLPPTAGKKAIKRRFIYGIYVLFNSGYIFRYKYIRP